jgi:hypothetical protein
MDKAIDPRAERAARRWLWAATAVFPLTPLLLPSLGSDSVRSIALLPMANCFAVWVFLSFKLRRTLSKSMAVRLDILAGRADGDTAEAVREIKASLRPVYVLFLWPWLLIPLTWVVVAIMKPTYHLTSTREYRARQRGGARGCCEQPPNKPMKRTLNSWAQSTAVPFGINFVRLGDLGGAIQRRLSPIRYTAFP